MILFNASMEAHASLATLKGQGVIALQMYMAINAKLSKVVNFVSYANHKVKQCRKECIMLT